MTFCASSILVTERRSYTGLIGLSMNAGPRTTAHSKSARQRREKERAEELEFTCDCGLALNGNGILLDRAEVSKRRPCGGLHTDGDPSYKDSEFETDSSNSVWAP
jgi:hypothetical protein